jgi:hypothetical protein
MFLAISEPYGRLKTKDSAGDWRSLRRKPINRHPNNSSADRVNVLDDHSLRRHVRWGAERWSSIMRFNPHRVSAIYVLLIAIREILIRVRPSATAWMPRMVRALPGYEPVVEWDFWRMSRNSRRRSRNDDSDRPSQREIARSFQPARKPSVMIESSQLEYHWSFRGG